MDIKKIVAQMDEMVSQGDIVHAVQQHFAEEATTSDYQDLTTNDKAQMVEKMEGFTGAIAKVNEITYHRAFVEGLHSASEFTFDFDMKDGSKIHWHEIIRRQWNQEGKVIREEYFLAN